MLLNLIVKTRQFTKKLLSLDQLILYLLHFNFYLSYVLRNAYNENVWFLRMPKGSPVFN